jgi:hypothetical protein
MITVIVSLFFFYRYNELNLEVIKTFQSSTPEYIRETIEKENDIFLRGSILKVKVEELGQIAVCAAVFQEARFITEWLIYVSLIFLCSFPLMQVTGKQQL